MTFVMCAVLLLVAAGGWLNGKFQDRRAKSALTEDTQEFDVVDAAFEDYQKSVADILDSDPQRRDDLVRELEAATAIWERAEFAAAVKPLRRSIAFRWAIRRALKTKATT